MSILIVILTALIISKVTSDECPFTDNDNDLIEYLENQKYEWTVLIKDISTKTHLHISYGFVISPQVILTSALGISGRKEKDLIVKADCTSAMVNCKYRRVVKIILPGSQDSHMFYASDYALLILKKPFYYAINNTAFARVKLTGNYSEINKSKCSIVRSKYEFCPLRLNKVSYDVNICEKNLVTLKDSEAKKLADDRDRIIFSGKDDTQFQIYVSLYGSPIVCETVENHYQKVLFGISLFDVIARVPSNNNDNPIVNLTGIYVNIVDNYYGLQLEINEAENYITKYTNQSRKNF